MKRVYIYRAAFLEVVDGDTIDVQIDLGFKVTIYERVRLNSIDTPEIFGPKAVLKGKVAKKFVEDWMDNSHEITLHSIKYDHREKYGRVLGDFYRTMPSGVPDVTSLANALRKAKLAK